MAVQSAQRTTSLSAPVRAPQRYEQVAERIAADIRLGRLAPGDRLPSERDLARALEVSRASVREAIAALQVEGVVETRPGSGSFVAADAAERVRALGRDDGAALALPHDASPSALLQARALIEPAVARLASDHGRPDETVERLLEAMDAASDPADAAVRAGWNESDRLFHRQIAAMTGNPVLIGIADHIAALMDQPLWQRLRDDAIATPGRTHIHLAEHRMIYEAIVEGDGEAAELYAAQHVRRVRRYMTLD
jgi:DNA-binding FadR family transcriptional regulator